MTFASCKKETMEPTAQPEADVLREPAATSENIYSLTATKKLQKIVYALSSAPYAAFTYDSKGRMTKAVHEKGTTTFTYKDSTVLIKRKEAGTNKTLDSLNGKLNTKGYLTYVNGYTSALNYETGKYEMSTRKHYYTYNSSGQLTKISTTVKYNGVTMYVKHYYSWLNGNLTAIKSVVTNGSTTMQTFTYDAAKGDKRGVWKDALLTWTDNLIGVRSKNLVIKTAISGAAGTPDMEVTETWKLNAEGYPVSSQMATNFSPWPPIDFTYTFQ